MKGIYLFIIFVIIFVMGVFREMLGNGIKRVTRILTSGHITKNFKWHEFDCRDNQRTPVPVEFRSNVIELCNNLEIIRDYFGGKSVYVTSGYRTYEYNNKIGGAVGSQHLLGNAADIRIKGVLVKDLHAGVLDLMNKGRIKAGGLAYSEVGNFVHYDIRGHYATWRYK